RELLFFKLAEATGVEIEELQLVSYTLEEIILPADAELQMNRKELDAMRVAQQAHEYVLKKEKGAQLPMAFAFGNISYAVFCLKKKNLSTREGFIRLRRC